MDGMNKGPTSKAVKQGGNHTQIRTEYPIDTGAMKANAAMKKGSMGGSTENLAHSLSGTSAKQRGA